MLNSQTLVESSLGFNRQSVQDALKTLQNKLSLYRNIPPNGLAMFCGYYYLDKDANKRKMVNIAFEPPSPLTQNLYFCGSGFQTELVMQTLSSSDQYGFIIVDGSRCSFFILSGNHRRHLFTFNVDLPKKHGRGGQSQNRFQHIREEKRHNYVTKVCEYSVKHFIEPKTSRPNVSGLILAGFANFKNEVASALDLRLKEIIVDVVDIQYGGKQGFHEAINKTKHVIEMEELKLERDSLFNFFDSIIKDNPVVYTPKDTIYALEAGAVQKLIVYNDLKVKRLEVMHRDSSNKEVLFSNENEDQDLSSYEVLNSEPLIDWLLDHYSDYGSEIILVSDSSTEGSQFVSGFGGIGGILRFEIVLPSQMEEEYMEDEDDELSFEW